MPSRDEWACKESYSKARRGSGLPPCKRRPITTLQKFAALFGGKAPQEFCCFFSSEKKQVKKAAKLRGATFFSVVIGLLLTG
jgi:hypothetical protein